MKIYTEKSLEDFEFWSGARQTADELTSEEFETLEDILSVEYPDGINATQLNDLFWFYDDFIANLLGYSDFDELVRVHKKQGL